MKIFNHTSEWNHNFIHGCHKIASFLSPRKWMHLCEKTAQLFPRLLHHIIIIGRIAISIFKNPCRSRPIHVPNFQSRHRQTRPFKRSYFAVDPRMVKENPLLYLEELGRIHLFKTKTFPRMVYANEGIEISTEDEGGLQRDFVSCLMEALFFKGEKEATAFPTDPHPDGGVFPISSGDPGETNNLKIIGFLLFHAIHSDLKIGECFPLEFYQILTLSGIESTSPKKGESDLKHHSLILAELILKKLPQDAVFQLALSETPFQENTLTSKQLLEVSFFLPEEMQPTGEEDMKIFWNNPIIRKALFDALLLEAQADQRLIALSVIAKQLSLCCEEHWEEVQRTSPKDLQLVIQGELHPQQLINSLDWSIDPMETYKPPQEEINRFKGFMRQWIESANEKELRNLVRALTGSYTLNEDMIHIKLFPRGYEWLPVAHTCTKTLELSTGYSDFDTFKKHINTLLTHGLADLGFQFI